MHRQSAAGAFTLIFMLVLAAAASAEQSYTVAGKDTFRFGSHDLHSDVAYTGSQTLKIARKNGATQYTAHVEYVREDQGAKAETKGSFQATILPTGEQRDEANRDPDFLTVLNQPFSVQLDPPTMQAIAGLRAPVPFDFPSPMTGAPLRGHLTHVADGTIAGTRTLGIGFSADGAMRGALPDRPRLSLAGKIRMTGTAYYDYQTALLLALDATLTINGVLDDPSSREPVTIVYHRSIRAQIPSPVKEARATPTGRNQTQ